MTDFSIPNQQTPHPTTSKLDELDHTIACYCAQFESHFEDFVAKADDSQNFATICTVLFKDEATAVQVCSHRAFVMLEDICAQEGYRLFVCSDPEHTDAKVRNCWGLIAMTFQNAAHVEADVKEVTISPERRLN